MTPERMAELVARWVRLYTRSLPPAIAERRIDEIDADLHDHVAHERAHGTGERRIALSIVARMLRGLAADASWRRRTITRSSTPKDVTMRRTVSQSVARVAIATGVILLLLMLLMLVTDGMNWGWGDFVLAGALLAGTGLLLELANRAAGNNIAYRVATVAVGVAAIAFGEADDAPGLVGFGCLLIIGTVVLAFRTAQRSG